MDHDSLKRNQTTAAIITGVGRSAIAVLAIRGSEAEEIVFRHFVAATLGPLRSGQIRYGTWKSRDEPGESVVLTPLSHQQTLDARDIGDNDNSQQLEIHCHGGPAASRRIMDDLVSHGVREVSGTELRIELASSRLIAEAEQVLARCMTVRTAAIALAEVHGRLDRWASDSISRIDRSPLDGKTVRAEASQIMASAETTTRLDQPFRVVLVGPPNVGKSSLVNAIVGFERSITMDVAGTTRDVLHVDTVIDGLPIQISDTAGIRQTDEAIEREGMIRAKAAAAEADLVVYISEPGISIQPLATTTPSINVLNKVDLIDQDAMANVISRDDVAVRTVANRGHGVPRLLERIAVLLAVRLPASDQAVVLNRRQADLVEKIAASEDAMTLKCLLEQLRGRNRDPSSDTA